MSVLQRLLDPQRLFDPIPGPATGLTATGLLILGLVLLLTAGVTAFAGWRRAASGQIPRTLWLSEAGLCAGCAALAGARLLAIPVLSMRALLLGGLILAALPPALWLLGQAGRRGWLRTQLRLLALCPTSDDAALPALVALALLVAHLAGLTLVYRFLGQPYILALPLAAMSLVALAIPRLLCPRAARPFSHYPLILTPLAALYAIVIAYRVAFVLLKLIPPIIQPFTLPDLGMAFFNLEANAWAVFIYVLLMEAALVLTTRGQRRWLLPGAATVLLIGTALWTTTDYVTHVATGVTAGDPYGYAQMAVDLATQGHPIHTFRLPALVTDLPIDPAPTTPIGYNLIDGTGRAVSSWPFGGAVPIALGYLLLGELGLYLTTPVVGLLSLLATAALAWEVTTSGGPCRARGWSRGYRLLAIAGAVFLLGTSYEQIDRLLVPMGDAAAQLATTLFLLFVIRGVRTGRLRDAALAGLMLGLAYLVRHTQVALLPLTAALAWPARNPFSPRKRVFLVGLAGLAALVVALPDLFYHWAAFGNPFQPEQSGELAAFALHNIPGSLGLLGAAFLSQHEFGWVLPFTLAGAWVLWRERRHALLILLAGVALLLAVHAPYYFVKTRDLLSAFPVAAVLTGLGLAAALRWVVRHETLGNHRWLVARAGLIAFAIFALSSRTWLMKPVRPHWAGYGGLTPAQRAAFDDLGALTPAGAAVGSSLNGGPIVLYSQRMTYRPGFWSQAEFAAFCQGLFDRGTPVYLLHDGAETHDALRYAQTHYRVTPAAWLDVPLFSSSDHASGVLYRIEPYP
ncbi:MAG: glycosyltransferase family 39 protein [Chloroflexi bacterium]|nr:glycosyltransferase family 39 protein [Chloroflexota bacterium]MBU1750321.1 glycosyltransferase family 39 protein [Chloroflexota bacterium]